MSALRLLLWNLIAWPLPALVAGALGWSSVWGSGSALADYLIPVPVAGGVLHVPSFVLCGLLVWNMPALGPRAASQARALLLGAAAAGLLWLLRLDDLLLAWRTGSTPPAGVWQQNPMGLFLLSDALVALLLTAGAPQRPWLRMDLATAALVLLPMALPITMAFQYSHADAPFLPGQSREGAARGDEITVAFTSLDVNAPDFRARAEAWSADRHPRLSVDSEDLALLFTRDLDAARRFDTGKAQMTLCLYEDGTPSVWLPGARPNDCFDKHVTFSEKLARARAARPAGEPPDLQGYMARRIACAAVPPLPAHAQTGGLELAAMRICSGMTELREKLRQQYPEAAAQLDAPP